MCVRAWSAVVSRHISLCAAVSRGVLSCPIMSHNVPLQSIPSHSNMQTDSGVGGLSSDSTQSCRTKRLCVAVPSPLSPSSPTAVQSLRMSWCVRLFTRHARCPLGFKPLSVRTELSRVGVAETEDPVSLLMGDRNVSPGCDLYPLCCCSQPN